MSDGRGKQTDDRTILDPLSTDELRALREARQRMQAKKGRDSAVAHQIVIGPDSGEDLGDAPTRAMPAMPAALPSFDGQVTLDQIGSNRDIPDPASGPLDFDRVIRARPGRPSEPPVARPAAPDQSSDPGPSAQGFGENTLLWMQPPRAPSGVGPGGTVTPDVLPRTNPQEALRSRLKAISLGVGFAAVAVAVVWVSWSPKDRGILELHTNPPKASVTINGKRSSEVTPVKLTLPEGEHQIALQLQGHEPFAFTTQVESGDTAVRKDVDLAPISRPGLMTVSVEVQPVAANVTLDGDIYAARRSLKLANLDPRRAHKIIVEAGGYVKIEQNIEPGRLKPIYRFVLEKDTTLPQ